MKVVILCGGKGTRMREETEYKPKPLVEIGGKPIIWHILKIYSYYGFNDFILCAGYKGNMIKQYFMEMCWRNNDFTLHTKGDNPIEYLQREDDDWHITIVDTGLETKTAGRLKQVEKYVDGEEFMFTYGDGVSNVNITELLNYHRKMGKIATVTGVIPASPYGIIDVEDGVAKAFREKPEMKDLINGGFMVLNRKIFDFIPKEDCFFEQEPLRNVVSKDEMAVYHHKGFWTAIDTVKDIERVNELWDSGARPWKVWL